MNSGELFQFIVRNSNADGFPAIIKTFNYDELLIIGKRFLLYYQATWSESINHAAIFPAHENSNPPVVQ